MKITKAILPVMASAALFVSCNSNNNDDINAPVNPDPYTVPSDYTFERNGKSSVDLTLGHQPYLKLKALDNSARDFKNIVKADLLALYNDKGNDAKSLKELTAASQDYFNGGNEETVAAKKFFNDYLVSLADDAAAHKNDKAKEGTAGTLGGKRMVDGYGIEYSQIVQKGLMGAVLLDQIFNQHLGDAVLKNSAILEANNKKTLVSGTNETELELHWDTAYGLLGLTKPEGVESFWAGYLSKELTDMPETKGIKEAIMLAFRTGRAAASAKDYKVMNEQAGIIREKLSLVAGIRAVHYLNTKIDPNNPTNSFHGLSEGLGFVYGLQFTRKKDGSRYLTPAEAKAVFNGVKGKKGLWDVDRLSGNVSKAGSLKYYAKMIGDKYGFDYTKP